MDKYKEKIYKEYRDIVFYWIECYKPLIEYEVSLVIPCFLLKDGYYEAVEQPLTKSQIELQDRIKYLKLDFTKQYPFCKSWSEKLDNKETDSRDKINWIHSQDFETSLNTLNNFINKKNE